MSASSRISSLLSVIFLFIASAYGLQNVAADGSVSTFDSSGKLLSTTDASGHRTFPGRSAATSPNSAPKQAAAAPAIAAPAIAAPAVTIHVPADQPTIQAAINAAANGDTVLVSDGTYIENINFNGKAITVTSVNGPAVTTIDGGKLNTVVLFVTGETSASVLNGFTITNGSAGFQTPNFGEGGGIAVENASPTITNNVITANGACNGVGIGVSFAAPLIQGNVISNNVQAGCSGGIGGGGISVGGESSGTKIIGNTIANNSMPAGGGGIALFAAGGPLIQNNIFSGNNGGNEGGGIAMFNNASPQIIDNAFTQNTAFQGGGMFWVIPVSTPGLLLLNNTMANNNATQGSAIFDGGFDTNMTIQNNILLGTAGVNAIFCQQFNGTTTPAVLSSNDVFTTGATAIGGNCTYATGTDGNISLDPLLTDPSVSNLHLQPLSPGIDAGNNTAPVALPATDLDGNPRINNAIVDMGALEFQGTTTTTFSATSLTFTQQLVGTKSAAQTITITNTGSTALQITPFTISGDFTEADDCHTSSGILAGKFCTVNVIFAPTARGTRTGQLGVISNDAAGPTTVNLSGVGIAPIVTLSTPSLTFGSQLVGTASTAQPVTVNNIGDAPLTVNGITASGDFSQTNDCGASVAINGSCTINVTFTPTLRGTRNGAVTMSDNAAGAPHVVTLQGTGIGPAATLGSASLLFAGQFTGTTSAAQSVMLTSSGETALDITSISASGDFAQTNDCGTSLPATQSCTIQVTFSPTVLGPDGGSITIVDNSTSTPELVTLSGMGTTFTIGMQPGGSSSATVNAGATASYNLTMIGTPGATGNVTFACSGAPSASTCTLSPASAALNGGTPVNFTVAVKTTARASVAPLSLMLPSSGMPLPVLAWPALAILLMVSFRKARLRHRAVLASAVLGIVMLMAACGGGGSTPPPPTPTPTPSPTPSGPGTPAGTSILAVTATSGDATRTFNLTLTVN